MQYILTESEYIELTTKKAYEIRMGKTDLQQLCTKIANKMPVSRSWDDTNCAPWGCILNKVASPGYCDECPVEEICPCENKEWSK